MTRSLVLASALLVAACAAAPEPAETEFSRMLIERMEASPNRATVRTRPTVEPVSTEAPRDPAEGLLAVSPSRRAELSALAPDEAALSEFLSTPISRDDLAALAVMRSPAIRAARARVEAARTGYQQSVDLSDLVAIYRAFTVSTDTRVGPILHRAAAEALAPTPNAAMISAAIVNATIAIATEDLRATVRDTVVEAEKAHAAAARLSRARSIVAEDLELSESLFRVLRSRFESGDLGQTGYYAFEGRLESLRAELDVLTEQEAEVRARVNRLLDRDAGAPLALGLDFAEPGLLPGPAAADSVAASALATRPEHLRARLMAERAATAVRLAETMTLPRMVMPRAEFGVREAQVQEMRARRAALDEGVSASGRSVASGVASALFAIEAARLRLTASEEKLVPLAAQSYEAARGAYEAGRAGYLDLLDAARRLLAARLTLADRRRALGDARAELIRVTGVIPGMEANHDER